MKLIDLLIQELPKHGGWPAGLACCCQSLIDNEIYFYDKMFENGEAAMILSSYSFYPSNKERVQFGPYEYVSLQQYEAALKTSEKFDWDGKGLPTVGVELEVLSPSSGWIKARVTAVTDSWIVAQYENGVEFAGTHRTMEKDGSWLEDTRHFRPIKTQADINREATIQSLRDLLESSGYDHELPESAARTVLNAIAQGKVSGIALTD